MSVISFDEDGEVWGAASVLIYDMILYFIRQAGPKEYLRKFKEMYDHGYKSLHLEDTSLPERKEVKKLVTDYLASGEYEIFGENDQHREKIRANLAHLVELIDASILRRVPL